MMAFRFEYPILLFWLAALLPYITYVVFRNRSRHIPWSRIVLFTFVYTLSILGLARPQMGHTETEAQALKSQIFFALDISRSMLCEDLPPSRLLFSKAFLQRLLPQLDQTKIAIFPMTVNGYLQLPLTHDWAAANDVIASLNPNLVSNPGTDLSKSLENLFTLIHRLEEKAKKAGMDWFPTQVVLFSDGESHTPIPPLTLKYFKNAKIPIHTIAVGTEQGGPIPSDRRGFDPSPFARDGSGKRVITKMDTENMRLIARESGGAFFPGRFESLSPLIKALRQSAVMGRLSTSFKVEQELFPLFFLFATLLLFIDLFTRRWSRVLALRASVLALLFIPLSLRAESATPAPDVDDETRAIQLYNEGVKEMKNNNPRKAAELFQESAAITPDAKVKKQALYNLGNAMFKQVDPSQAIEAYQQAFETRAGDKQADAEVNQRISDNLVLATQLLEEIKKMQQQGQSENPDDNDQDKGKNPNDPKDPKGPKQFKAQDFDESQKRKIFDLVASEEQQTMQRLMEGRNRGEGGQVATKPW